MIKFKNALKVWETMDFEAVLKDEILKLKPEQLPLQQGLSQSSHVSDGKISVVVLNVTEAEDKISIKTGIFYAGVIAGSCCADDPTPMDEQPEYCEVQFDINKTTAETIATLIN